jgi:Zn-dependent protease
MVLVAAAGPLSNLVIAALAGIPIRLGVVPFFHPFIPPSLAGMAAEVWTQSPAALAGLFLGTVVLLNVMLAVFNLLPLAPLDGFRVVVGLLPPHLGRELSRLEAWGPGLLMVLFFMPFFSNGRFNPISDVMSPVIALFLGLVAGDPGRLIFG